MGGNVYYEREDDETAFVIVLPLATGAPAETQVAVSPRRQAEQPTQRAGGCDGHRRAAQPGRNMMGQRVGGTTGLGPSGTFVASWADRGPGRLARLGVTFLVVLLVIMGLPPLPFAIGGDSPVRVTIVADPPGPTARGETITYTAFVQNEGHETQTDVQVTAPIPAGTSLVEGSTKVSLNPSVIAVVADDFESGTLEGSAGLNPWSGVWTPRADSAGATVVIDEDAGSSVLSVKTPATGITRTVDLSGFPAAYLTYRYKRIELPKDGTFAVEIAGAGQESFAPVDQLAGAGSGFTEPIYQTQTVDISRFISNATQIRFATDGPNLPEGTGFRIDEVTITSVPPAGIVGLHPQVASGFTLLPGDEIAVTYSVVVNEELGGQTEFVAEVAVISAEDQDPRSAKVVVELNQPPVAADDAAETAPGRSVTINVLANDTDPNNEPLSVTEVGEPGSGTATANEDGTVTYQPAEEFRGEDVFRYAVSDPLGETAGAAVTVTVTDTAVVRVEPTATLTERIDVALSPDKLSLPMTFEQNRGQTDAAVDYVARGKGYQVFLAGGDAVLALGNGNSGFAVRMDLVDGADVPQVISHNQQPGYVNYFRGNDPEKWQTEVPAYAAVEYRDVYPGIDLRYYGNDRQLEYDFIVQSGADPGSIALRFEGATSVAIDNAGDLVIGLNPGRSVSFSAPITFQDVDGERVAVDSGYVVDGDTVWFTLGEYDPNLPLVIDPTLQYGSYLGGTGTDSGSAITVDGSGNIIVGGYSASSDFPVTVGAYDETANGNNDVTVTKLSADGSTLLWSTYLGGSGLDNANDIAIDGSGAVYVGVYTASSNFPTTAGAFDTSLGGLYDGAVAKLSANGASLLYSTYLGGSGANDYLRAIAVDASGQAVVAGATDSSNFPTVGGSYDTSFGGTFDAFVTKINTTGTGLVWSTYIGGAGSDGADDVVLDGSGTVYITGQAASGFPTTAGAYDSTVGGTFDGHATKLSADGSTLLYATVFGGSASDVARAIAVADASTLYVGGDTPSSDFPTTAGAYDTTKSSSDDMFVLRLDLTQTGSAQLEYSTFIGGAGIDRVGDLAVDASSRAHVFGYTQSTGLATAGAYDTTLGGSSDTILGILSADGSAMEELTYVGGDGGESVGGLHLTVNSIYLTGNTTSAAGFPITGGAYQSASSGTSDGFVVRFESLAAPDPLIGHWTFDADATDSSGNDYHGTLTNGAVINTDPGTNNIGAGKVSLDGSNDYVDLSAHIPNFQNLAQGTITAWVYADAASTDVIFEASDSGDSDSRVAVIRNSDGSLEFYVREGGTGTLLDVRTIAGMIPESTWTHVAVSVDATGNRLYVNGVEVTSGDLTYSTGSSATSAFFNDVTNLDFMAWGVHRYTPDDSAYANEWYGFIDDARLYDVALSGTDVADLAAQPPVAVDDAVSTPVDTAVVVDVLANDTDVNGDALTVDSVTQGSNGSVVNNGTDVTYTPNAAWNGVDTFTYTVSDGNGGTDTATVTATVGTTPIAPTAVWRQSGQSTPYYAPWDGSAFGGTQMSASIGDFRIIQGAESPSRDEAIVVGVASGGTIAGEMWDGSSWSALPALGTTTQDYWWSVDVAYEPASGDAMVVYADGAALNYRVWNGATWSGENPIPEPPGGTPRQMQLAAHPYSDEMVLIVSNDSSQDYAVVWDGSSWGNGLTLDSTGAGNDRTDVYVAYEQQSGRALVVWGSGNDNVHFRVWDSGLEQRVCDSRYRRRLCPLDHPRSRSQQ